MAVGCCVVGDDGEEDEEEDEDALLGLPEPPQTQHCRLAQRLISAASSSSTGSMRLSSCMLDTSTAADQICQMRFHWDGSSFFSA